MKIVADENIPLAQAFFSHLGEVVTRPGRELQAADLIDADALIVRSVTRVDQRLLDHSPVAFVGTCTIGVDHLDLGYLAERGIAHASAPGCNADSVVEYVFSALSALDQPWQGQTFGIIGCGNVGGRLYRRLRELGVDCRCYDPFLTAEDNPDLDTLEQVLDADIVSLHTPLTQTGAHPTHHLLGQEEIRKLKPGAMLLNCGRGPVIDNKALLSVLKQRPDLRVVLDVWEPEPNINLALLEQVTLGTPHIAGYSFDGKVRGTEMIYNALCATQKIAPTRHAEDLLTAFSAPEIDLSVLDSDWQRLRHAVLQAYDIRDDDGRLRAAAKANNMAVDFDALRKHYPQRREFFNYHISGFTAAKNKPLSVNLAALRFAQRALS